MFDPYEDTEMIEKVGRRLRGEPDVQPETTGYVPTNREKARRGSKRKFWCSHCDAQLVGQVGKCPTCGGRENRKKIKGT